MNKKIIVLAIFALVILSLSSCRSKKNSCAVDTLEQQNIEVVYSEIK